MVVVLREDASPDARAEIARLLARAGDAAQPLADGAAFRVGAPLPPELAAQLEAHPAVARLAPVTTPYVLASRVAHPQPTRVRVGDVLIGGDQPVVIAGPCAVESEEQVNEAARAARRAGAHLLRGGAFKPRTSPYSFQGLGLRGLELLSQAGRATGLPVVTEVMEPALVEPVAALADVLQVGSRNMQNFPLLRAVGRARRPVLLKRGFAATIEEWLLAAEYILAEGNPDVILCERGVRGFDPQTRNVLDLACVPLLRGLTHLPILVDPSHATGRRDLVLPMGVAAIAAGADGLLVEMHPHPAEALSDAEQAISPGELQRLIARVNAVRAALAAPAVPPLPVNADAEPTAAPDLVAAG
jgi:3-deoxy-7-phosphoheptulonate synthase